MEQALELLPATTGLPDEDDRHFLQRVELGGYVYVSIRVPVVGRGDAAEYNRLTATVALSRAGTEDAMWAQARQKRAQLFDEVTAIRAQLGLPPRTFLPPTDAQLLAQRAPQLAAQQRLLAVDHGLTLRRIVFLSLCLGQPRRAQELEALLASCHNGVRAVLRWLAAAGLVDVAPVGGTGDLQNRATRRTYQTSALGTQLLEQTVAAVTGQPRPRDRSGCVGRLSSAHYRLLFRFGKFSPNTLCLAGLLAQGPVTSAQLRMVTPAPSETSLRSAMQSLRTLALLAPRLSALPSEAYRLTEDGVELMTQVGAL